jgi:hypothetical protein
MFVFMMDDGEPGAKVQDGVGTGTAAALLVESEENGGMWDLIFSFLRWPAPHPGSLCPRPPWPMRALYILG